jgi:hypothetical protein
MPLDTWEENSALEIGTLCLRLSHPVAAIARTTNRSMTPEPFPHPLASQCPMTEGLQVRCHLMGPDVSIGHRLTGSGRRFECFSTGPLSLASSASGVCAPKAFAPALSTG